MKILYIVDYYQPKLGYASYYIPKELAKMKHDVYILTSDHYYPFPNYSETTGKILGDRKVGNGVTRVEHVTIIRKKLVTELFTRAIFGGQEETIRKIRPSVVIVDKTAGYSQIVACLLKDKYKYRLISVDAHLPSGFEAEGNQLAKTAFYWLFRLFFSKLINSKVDKFIPVQEETETIMKKYYGVNRNIKHIPLGTDVALFKRSVKQGSIIRKKYNLKKSDFVIVYTGKIIKEKGVDILFKALSILSLKYTNIKLLLVGSGPQDYLDYCFSRIDATFRNRVIVTGFVLAAELPKYYSAATIGVWPLQESMSMNDAASCALPFIANNKIGARYRIKSGCAVLYTKGSSHDLAKKIETLYRDPKKIIAMGIKGSLFMKKELSWARIAAKYID